MSNRDELKSNVYLERIIGLINENAELRVELHILSEKNEELESQRGVQKGEDTPTDDKN